jgi:hypothetical protein
MGAKDQKTAEGVAITMMTEDSDICVIDEVGGDGKSFAEMLSTLLPSRRLNKITTCVDVDGKVLRPTVMGVDR